MYSRYAHCVGGFSNFLVTFGGQGKYEEKTKFREQFNDIAVFDVYNNQGYAKYEGNLAAFDSQIKN